MFLRTRYRCRDYSALAAESIDDTITLNEFAIIITTFFKVI